MKERGSIMDVVIYSTLMSGLCKNGRIHDALILLAEMLDRGIKPSIIDVLQGGSYGRGDGVFGENIGEEVES